MALTGPLEIWAIYVEGGVHTSRQYMLHVDVIGGLTALADFCPRFATLGLVSATPIWVCRQEGVGRFRVLLALLLSAMRSFKSALALTTMIVGSREQSTFGFSPSTTHSCRLLCEARRIHERYPLDFGHCHRVDLL
jgi:hypothetical protein